MRLSRDSQKTIEWLYAAENKGGGIAAWKEPAGAYFRSYPEVTGYLCTTLRTAGCEDLAQRCGEWLESVQNADGSWNDLGGAPRSFDTAAIIDAAPKKIWLRGKAWLEGMIAPEGYLMPTPGAGPEIYNLRASGIICNPREADYWRANPPQGQQRSHYLAYAVEGLMMLQDPLALDWLTAFRNHFKSGLVPFWLHAPGWADAGGDDICATIQMAILYARAGFPEWENLYISARRYVEPNGGVPQSTTDKRQIAWAAKFWLDLNLMIDKGEIQ